MFHILYATRAEKLGQSLRQWATKNHLTVIGSVRMAATSPVAGKDDRDAKGLPLREQRQAPDINQSPKR